MKKIPTFLTTCVLCANIAQANQDNLGTNPNSRLSQQFQECISREIENNDDFARIMTYSIAENFEETLKPKSGYDQVNYLLQQTSEHNVVQYLRKEVANKLLHNCTQGFLELINNPDVQINLCLTHNDGEMVKFQPSIKCLYSRNDFEGDFGQAANRFHIPLTFKSLHKYVPGQYAYIITSEKHRPGDTISKDALSYNPWPRNCSTHHPGMAIYDDDPLNTKAQNVFGGGHEYFADVHYGDTLAFPGIILGDENLSTSEKIVTYKSLQTALDKGNAFVQNLKGTACESMSINLVSLAQLTSEHPTTDFFWGSTASAGAGLGTLYVLAGHATAAAAGKTGLALLPTAAGVSGIPVAGWIIAGTLVASSIALSMIDADILDYPGGVYDALVLKSWDIAYD